MGFPIRTSPDQGLLGASPGLFAACHVLRRLLAPRHPPYALTSLARCSRSLWSFQGPSVQEEPLSRQQKRRPGRPCRRRITRRQSAYARTSGEFFGMKRGSFPFPKQPQDSTCPFAGSSTRPGAGWTGGSPFRRMHNVQHGGALVRRLFMGHPGAPVGLCLHRTLNAPGLFLKRPAGFGEDRSLQRRSSRSSAKLHQAKGRDSSDLRPAFLLLLFRGGD